MKTWTTILEAQQVMSNFIVPAFHCFNTQQNKVGSTIPRILPIIKSSKRVPRLPFEISFVAPAYLPVKEPPLPDIDPVDKNIILSVGTTLEYEYLKELKWLHNSLSEDPRSNISCAFKQGLFVVQKSGNVFSGIGLDQAHEQNNAVIKGDGGAVGLLTDPAALRIWMFGGPEITQLIAEFEESNATKSKDLFSLETDIAVDEESVERIMHAGEVGQKQYTAYVEDRTVTKLENTYGENSDFFKEHMKSDCAKLGAKRVDIVWDTYDKESTKSYARHMRGVGERRRVTRKGWLPLNWATFLRNINDKTEHCAMLAEDITTCPALGNVTVWSTKGSDVLSNNSNLNKAALAPSDHKEAESRVFVHVLDAVASGCTNTCLKTVDTDDVVSGVVFFHELREQGLKKVDPICSMETLSCNSCSFHCFKTGRGQIHCNERMNVVRIQAHAEIVLLSVSYAATSDSTTIVEKIAGVTRFSFERQFDTAPPSHVRMRLLRYKFLRDGNACDVKKGRCSKKRTITVERNVGGCFAHVHKILGKSKTVQYTRFPYSGHDDRNRINTVNPSVNKWLCLKRAFCWQTCHSKGHILWASPETLHTHPQSMANHVRENEATPECKGGCNGRSRENPLIRDILRYNSHIRISGSDSTGNQTQVAFVGGEYYFTPLVPCQTRVLQFLIPNLHTNRNNYTKRVPITRNNDTSQRQQTRELLYQSGSKDQISGLGLRNIGLYHILAKRGSTAKTTYCGNLTQTTGDQKMVPAQETLQFQPRGRDVCN
ncbi:hypothetical protein PR048_006794 [Dryococelus australis]|uniref:Uncharacterized protein n=1 Tax=Dryococelus australis TaxID=614101 RepID=A0ABQ9IBX3_9NEOP|nr:hypothetical protein PR048_006794 [Dryococelus australis]